MDTPPPYDPAQTSLAGVNALDAGATPGWSGAGVEVCRGYFESQAVSKYTMVLPTYGRSGVPRCRSTLCVMAAV